VTGTEDLGGGLAAYFTFESSVNMADGTTTGTSFGDRGAFVGVKGAFGAIDAGASRLSPSFYAGAAIDASQTNNYGIFNFGGATRNDTSINYTSNNLGGLIVRASMIMEDNLTTGHSYYDMSGVYTAGALTVAASYADNGTTTGNMIGAAYNFGPATVSASSTQLIADEAKAWNVGVRAPIGAVTLSADFSKNKDTSVKSSVVAAQYALSKRSSLTAYAKKVDDKQNELGFGIRHNF
jgi:predicted porin